MKKIKSFNNFISEGLKDKMKPKPMEDILDNVKKSSSDKIPELIFKYDLVDYFTKKDIIGYINSIPYINHKIRVMTSYYEKYNFFTKNQIISEILNIEEDNERFDVIFHGQEKTFFNDDDLKKLYPTFSDEYKLRFIQDRSLYHIVTEKEINRLVNKFAKELEVNIFNEIIGKIIKDVDLIDKEINFHFDDGSHYRMYHEDDCCEIVFIEDINGDLDDLIGSPLIKAEEVVSKNEVASEDGNWTFYKFATIKGYVDIRWYGSSNGYYSTRVTFKKIN